LNALQTVGYSEWWPYFEGEYSREAAIEKIKQHSRNYAKRQITWFKNQL
jgi:tRNA dimethylallyltransferase